MPACSTPGSWSASNHANMSSGSLKRSRHGRRRPRHRLRRHRLQVDHLPQPLLRHRHGDRRRRRRPSSSTSTARLRLQGHGTRAQGTLARPAHGSGRGHRQGEGRCARHAWVGIDTVEVNGTLSQAVSPIHAYEETDARLLYTGHLVGHRTTPNMQLRCAQALEHGRRGPRHRLRRHLLQVDHVPQPLQRHRHGDRRRRRRPSNSTSTAPATTSRPRHSSSGVFRPARTRFG